MVDAGPRRPGGAAAEARPPIPAILAATHAHERHRLPHYLEPRGPAHAVRIEVPVRLDAISRPSEDHGRGSRHGVLEGKEFEIETALREASPTRSARLRARRHEERRGVRGLRRVEGRADHRADPGRGSTPRAMRAPPSARTSTATTGGGSTSSTADGRGVVREGRHRDPDAQALDMSPPRADASWAPPLALVAAAAASILWLPPPGQGTATGRPRSRSSASAPARSATPRRPGAGAARTTTSRCRRRGRRPSSATSTTSASPTRASRPATTEGREALVRTDGPGSRLTNYSVALRFRPDAAAAVPRRAAGGRLQALSVAWNSSREGAGRQRWFHLYPGERVDYRDVLHWTRLRRTGTANAPSAIPRTCARATGSTRTVS